MIGREKEVKELLDLYENSKAELVAIYGRRRVGKTYLINQTFKNKFTFKHTAISPDENESKSETLKLQLNSFYNSLIKFGLEKSKNLLLGLKHLIFLKNY